MPAASASPQKILGVDDGVDDHTGAGADTGAGVGPEPGVEPGVGSEPAALMLSPQKLLQMRRNLT